MVKLAGSKYGSMFAFTQVRITFKLHYILMFFFGTLFFPGFKVCNVRPLLTLLTSYTLLTIGHKLPYLKTGEISMV